MKRSRTPLLDREVRDVFRSARSWSDVVVGLRDVRVPDDQRIHLLAVGSTGRVEDVVREHPRTGLKQLHQRDSLSLYSYTRRFGRKRPRRVNGEFLIARQPDGPVSYIVCVCSSQFFRHGLAHLLETLYPHVSRAFLTQRELGGVLRALQKAVAPDALRIQEYLAKRRLRSPARKKFESVRDWTDVDIDSAFHEAAERNVWFRSVRFAVVGGRPEPTKWVGTNGQVSKYAHVAVDGSFDLIEEVIGRRLIEITTERTALFSNRERVHTRDNVPMPLEVTYERDVFRTPDEIKRLLDSLRRFPHGTCTVLHANPYLHAALVDDIDFSAADVWVLSQKSILVVPQLKASNAALKRMVNHIFENFGEGRIGEPKEAQ
jgi:hypothetical protein